MLISFEGIEGAGKSTQARRVQAWLEGRGLACLLTREPGGTAVGDQVRQVLLRPDNEMCPETELFLLQASRRELCRRVIEPALREGRIVLVDRFGDSSVAYQGYGHGLDLEMVRRIVRLATGGLEPKRTFVFDIEPELGLERCTQEKKTEKLGGQRDRMEVRSVEFFRRIRNGYLEMAAREPERFSVIPVTGSPEDTFSQLEPILKALFD